MSLTAPDLPAISGPQEALAPQRAPASRVAPLSARLTMRVALAIATASSMVAAAPAVLAQADSPRTSGEGTAQGLLDWALPPAPLDSTLAAIARAGSRGLVADPALLTGRRAPAIQGRLSVEDAARQALAGHCLELAATSSGSLTIREPADPAACRPDSTDPGSPSAGRMSPTPGGTQLPEVVVRAAVDSETATGPVLGLTARRSATASKTDLSILETAQTLSVISREQLEWQDVQSVTRALEYTPGTIAAFGGTNSNMDVVQARGFYPRDYLDGLRLPFSAYSVAVPQFDPYMLERIELLQGPASVLYGQSTPGGIINMVSRRPRAEPARELLLQVGNGSRRQLGFDSTGALDGEGRLLYRLTGLARDSDGFNDFSTSERQMIAPSLTCKPNGRTSLTLLTHYQHDELIPQYQPLPASGTLRPNPNGRLPRSRFAGDPAWDRFDRKQYGIGYAIEHRFNETLTLRQNLRHTDVRVHSRGTPGIALAVDSRTLSRVATEGHAVGSLFAVDTQLEARFATAGLRHALLAGLDYQKQSDDYRFASGAATALDLYAPVYGMPTPAVQPRLDTGLDMRQLGLYLQDQMEAGPWRLTLGLRHDSARSDTTNRVASTVAPKSDDAVSGRLGIGYLVQPSLAVYASFSTSFEPVAGTDFEARPFEPSTGRQLEVGVKYQPIGADTLLTAALYRLTQRNVLTADPTPGRETFSVQTGEAQVNGLSLEARTRLSRVDLLASYAWTDAEYTRANPSASGTSLLGRPLVRTPRHQAAAWASYRVGDEGRGWVLSLGARYIGSNVSDTGQTIVLPARTLVDAAIHYDFGQRESLMDRVRLTLGLANLGDREYVSYCLGAMQCFYGQPRTVQLSLRKRW